MNLNSIPAFDDNYIWVLNDEAGRCLIVDPGDAEPVLNAIAANVIVVMVGEKYGLRLPVIGGNGV